MARTYIDNTSLDRAKATYLSALKLSPKTEWVEVERALGRYSAESVTAKRSSPSCNVAAMDGIAVIAADTESARTSQMLKLSADQYTSVNTGNPIDKPYDAVIMVESIINSDDDGVFIKDAVRPLQHIRIVGEDIAQGEIVLMAEHRICARDIGALVASGNEQVLVYKKPIIGILPTGSEIVQDQKSVQKGTIIDSNSPMICALIKEFGADCIRYSVVDDNIDTLVAQIKSALTEVDSLLIIAGSSTGGKDYTRRAIERAGGQVHVHGLAIKPGKPAILAQIRQQPVIGLPGYPVSSFVVFKALVEPIIATLGGIKADRQVVYAKIATDFFSSLKHREYVRVALAIIRDELLAIPMKRHAGSTMSLVKSQGMAIIPRSTEGLKSGDRVEVELFDSTIDFDKNLIVVGSHDISLDLLARELPLLSAHVGSMGGVMALRDNSAHIAPIHLLDKASGSYNRSHIERYFDQPMALIKGLRRQQGLIVANGNPLALDGIASIAQNRAKYLNRQNGSGTRLLFDYLLGEQGVRPDSIDGYDNELTSHLAVAQCVRDGYADVGMGIYAAAKIMQVDFIPLFWEHYDFLVYRSQLSDDRIQRFITALQSRTFQADVMRLGGYDFEHTGGLVYVN